MILPTKRLSPDRALLTIGAEILSALDESKTVSRIWEDFRLRRGQKPHRATVTFDWFVLALDLLYMIGSIEMERGKIRRTRA